MIKCIIWDLDETLWDGVLLESSYVRLREDIVEVIKYLDQRGVLHSIASKNNEIAKIVLREQGIFDYFLFPQVNWGAKSSSVLKIADKLKIRPSQIAFVDDDPYERGEVKHTIPDISCFTPDDARAFISDASFKWPEPTSESRNRKKMYLDNFVREEAEENYEGPAQEFLDQLEMRAKLFHPNLEDLARAGELVERTSQLNTTGYRYERDDIVKMMKSHRHIEFMMRLRDRYGDYGNVGIAFIEAGEEKWVIKLFATSCRVMNKGAATVFIKKVIELGMKNRVKVLVEFVHNEFNRPMYITLKFIGFMEVSKHGHAKVLEFGGNLSDIKTDHIDVAYES